MKLKINTFVKANTKDIDNDIFTENALISLDGKRTSILKNFKQTEKIGTGIVKYNSKNKSCSAILEIDDNKCISKLYPAIGFKAKSPKINNDKGFVFNNIEIECIGLNILPNLDRSIKPINNCKCNKCK